jgi:amidophosphoribosyltransferase
MNKGSIFYSSSDTECLIHLLAQEKEEPEKALIKCLPLMEGAYSLTLLTKDSLIAARDPMGFRPLVLGQRNWKDEQGVEKTSWVVASETCAFDLIGAKLVREIEPGEIWIVDEEKGVRSLFLQKNKKQYHCVFEHVYFARPDSQVFGKNVYQSRKAMGRFLAEESQVPADLVIPVPDSGVPAAIGYSEACGIPYDMGIVRNHYIGRTFIHPSQSIRDFKVKIKLSAQRKLIAGKKVVVVDDSLVRGTTSRSVVKMLRQAGAGEIHFRISSPPITGPCFYGVDTPEKSELIASKMSVEEIKNYLQVESLSFLSTEGLMKAVQVSRENLQEEGNKAQRENGFCSACFTGDYPTATYTH